MGRCKIIQNPQSTYFRLFDNQAPSLIHYGQLSINPLLESDYSIDEQKEADLYCFRHSARNSEANIDILHNHIGQNTLPIIMCK